MPCSRNAVHEPQRFSSDCGRSLRHTKKSRSGQRAAVPERRLRPSFHRLAHPAYSDSISDGDFQMGYSIAWLAAQGKQPQSLLAEFDLRPTGKAGEYPDDPMVGAPLDGGWYLLVARGCDHRMISDQVLKTLSRRCRVIACSIEEHVMFSGAALWENGERVWSVSHQGDENL